MGHDEGKQGLDAAHQLFPNGDDLLNALAAGDQVNHLFYQAPGVLHCPADVPDHINDFSDKRQNRRGNDGLHAGGGF